MENKIEEINKEVMFYILLQEVITEYDECLRRLS